jgi:hypothetical protein
VGNAVLHRVNSFALQGGASLCNRFSGLLARQAARLDSCVALCRGRLLDSTMPLADALSQCTDPADAQRIELLCPTACAAAQAAGACWVPQWLECPLASLVTRLQCRIHGSNILLTLQPLHPQLRAAFASPAALRDLPSCRAASRCPPQLRHCKQTCLQACTVVLRCAESTASR